MSIAATVWMPRNGEGEYTTVTASDIADPSGNLLVDPSSNQIVDTGLVFTAVAATVWTENEAA